MPKRLAPLLWAAPLIAAAQPVAPPAESAGYPWPETVVGIEALPRHTPLEIRVPAARPRGDVRRAAILRLHVGADGQVRHSALLESCGSPAHDEAALHAVRDARFLPAPGSEARDVTLILPLHLPLSQRKRGLGDPF